MNQTEHTIRFDVPREHFDTIIKICERAERECKHLTGTRMDLVMDLSATHASGCPLKLDELLNANDSDFGHDIHGIRRHINRETGRLEGCFLPRFADTKAVREGEQQ